MNLTFIEIIIIIFAGIAIVCFSLSIYYSFKQLKTYDKLENIFVDLSNNMKKEIEEYYKKEEKIK